MASEQEGVEDSLAVHIQQGLAPVKAPQGWSLGNLLTGVLQRGIRVSANLQNIAYCQLFETALVAQISAVRIV